LLVDFARTSALFAFLYKSFLPHDIPILVVTVISSSEFFIDISNNDVIRSINLSTQAVAFAIHIILEEGNTEETRVDKFIERITSLFEISIKNSDDEITVTTNIGMSCGKKDLYKNANNALVRAKSTNKALVLNDAKLTEELEQTNILKKQLTKIVNNAIKNENILPYYQPIFCNKTKKIVKYECLVRIETEDGGIISPEDFIDISKKLRKYEFLTQQMITKTFKRFKKEDCKFSINLSIEDIENTNTRKFIINQLKSYSNSHNVIFEILEDEDLYKHEDIFYDFVKDVKEHGCEIAIDDFGTGFSNFRNLLKMEIDYIKIDGTIIQDITNEKVFTVLQNIVNLAKVLNAKTIAEYVCTKEIQEKVMSSDIDFSQGWFFGKAERDLVCQ
jgi:EAL domain-containing protein (putative c-di-GMP-specific phosphodiesterase class I)